MNKQSILGLALAAALIVPQAAQAAGRTSMASSSSSSSRSSSGSSLSTGLAGKIGLDVDTVKTTPGAAAAFAAPNALGFRYWTSDVLGIDGAFALQNNSSSGSGATTFGLGGGITYNWKKPSDNFLIQWLLRASFASASTSTTVAGTTVTANQTLLALMGGVGFEAFIPAWPALSVSGNMGLELDSAGGSGASSSSINVVNSGSSPINVAIHYYFE
jgi:hypothetical protein